MKWCLFWCFVLFLFFFLTQNAAQVKVYDIPSREAIASIAFPSAVHALATDLTERYVLVRVHVCVVGVWWVCGWCVCK